MLAESLDLPRAADRSWAYEVKWDGMRVLATMSRGRLRLTSRNGNDATTRFPEVSAAAPEGLAEGSVLDGEVVAFDAVGRPSFALLAPRIQRAHVSGSAPARVTFLSFDLLRLGDDDVTGLPYDRRRALLAEHVAGTSRVLVPDSFDDGAALLASTAQQGLEGVVAEAAGLDVPAGRAQPRLGEGAAPAYAVARDRRLEGAAGLAVAARVAAGRRTHRRRAAALRGAVGSGLSGSVSRTLLQVLGDIASERSPFHGYPAPDQARGDLLYVAPLLVVDVEHLGRAANGLRPCASRRWCG